MGEKKDAGKNFKEQDRLFGNGFMWFMTSFVSVILPTVLEYLYRNVSKDEAINITDFYKNILLVLFSICGSMIMICIDIRSRLINKTIRQIVFICSFFMGIFVATFYFYILDKEYIYGEKVLYSIVY